MRTFKVGGRLASDFKEESILSTQRLEIAPHEHIHETITILPKSAGRFNELCLRFNINKMVVSDTRVLVERIECSGISMRGCFPGTLFAATEPGRIPFSSIEIGKQVYLTLFNPLDVPMILGCAIIGTYSGGE